MSVNDMFGRRLRFPIELGEDESIPGAIARGVGLHVLVATKPVLDAAGVQLRHAGLAQLGTEQEITQLAGVIRCDPQALLDRRGSRVRGTTGKMHRHVRFGALTMPRAFLELNRRRIAPVSLAKRDYHRMHWMNLLLPYCAESLERLVDRCSHCDALLGWHFAQGIGHCDTCGELVVPAEAPVLAREFADGYRRFSNLSSPHHCAVELARSELPAELRQVDPGALVNFALQLGTIAEGSLSRYASNQALMSMEARNLAESAAIGTEFLQTFPFGLRDWVSERVESCGQDAVAIESLRARFRVLAGKSAYPGVPALVEHALPNIADYASPGLVTTKRYYLYIAVRQALRFNNFQMRRLKVCSSLKLRNLSAPAKRRLFQYDAEQIDQLAVILRRTKAGSSVGQRFRLPFYGIEQLCLNQDLEVESHFIQHIASDKLHVRSSSVADLLDRIRAASSKGKAPRGSVKLMYAANQIGGGLKPWGKIVGEMLGGSFPFWMSEPAGDLRHVMIMPRDLNLFRQTSVELRKLPLGLEQFMSQRDAAEVLNITPHHLAHLAEGLEIRFQRRGRGLAASRGDVLRAARCTAWPGEIGMHLGVKTQSVRSIMKDQGILNVSTGWDRQQLRRIGVLPA